MADLRRFTSPAREAGASSDQPTWGAGDNSGGTSATLSVLKLAEPAAGYEGEARYCPMLAVDIKAFNDPRRGEDVQRFLRAAMYQLLAGAFDGSSLQWPACHREDRGDGVLVVAPPGTPETALIDPVVDYLRAGLRRHNKLCSDLATIRLRMAVHAGQVQFDHNGVSGYAVNHLFRMLEAAAFKRAFAAAGADFALVASEALYEDVISQGPGLIDPDMYAPINIRCKETRARAWLYLPPVRNPFLHGVSNSRRPSGKAGEKRTGPAARAGGQPARAGGQPLAGPSEGPSSAASSTPGLLTTGRSITEAATVAPLPAAATTPVPAPAPLPAAATAPVPAPAPLPAAATTPVPAPVPAAARAAVPRPRVPLSADNQSAREGRSDREPLPASRAVGAQGWLGSVADRASAQARFRGRRHPGQRA